VDSVAVSGFGLLMAGLPRHATEGLCLRDIDTVGIAAIMTRPQVDKRTADALTNLVGDARGGAAIAVGPGNLLVVRLEPSPSWIAQLSHATDGVAHVFDHSSGYAVLELKGSAGCIILQKGIFIDLDRGLADVGSSVCSVIAHINVLAWRSASDCIVIAVPRSFAGSFWHWLTTAAAAENIALGQKL
jgi:heterotetrameric sarcosine oxidase gamma subunit